MRIIAGKFKKKRLESVTGMATRPTSDRLRETLFNIISDRVAGATVLDLFAGTGALGLEAMSRHADRAVFIDSQKGAIAAINNNIKSCGLENETRVVKWDIVRNLNCLAGEQKPFTLIFIDPPYLQNMIEKTLVNLEKTGTLSPGALIVSEHSDAEEIIDMPERFTLVERRRYGKTAVSFIVYEK